MANGPVVFYHMEEKEKQEQLQAFCSRHKLSQKQITRKDADRTLGALLGMYALKSELRAPVLWQMPELLLLAGFSDPQLDRFLQAWRDEGLLPVALKATVTPSNVGWTVYQLANCLVQEHREMTGRG